MVTLTHIRDAWRDRRAAVIRDASRPRAAVSLVLREHGDSPQLLFIERARRRGDPWSGHMAFPGGRMEARDRSTRSSAERETREEVGISLLDAERLGRLDDIEGFRSGRRLSLVISAYAYHLPREQALVTNCEVAAALWIPLEQLLDRRRHVAIDRESRSYPGIAVGDAEHRVVWGITYRFLESFFAVTGHALPSGGDGWSNPPRSRGRS